MSRQLPEQINGLQALAWICWRSMKAVRRFSGSDATALWEAARQGRFPEGLGQPMVPPLVAERALRERMRLGELKPL